MSHSETGWTLRRLGIIPVFFLSLNVASAQEVFYGTTSMGLGGCYTNSGTGGGGLINEASLADDDALVFTGEQLMPFISREVGISTLTARLPVTHGAFGLSASHLGIPGFRQFSASVGYGLRLSEKLAAGVGFHYTGIVASGEWNYLRRLGVSGGIRYELFPGLLLGMHVYNPVTISNYPEYGQTAPSLISFGMQHDLYDNTTWYLEAEHHSIGGWRFKTGAELAVADRFIVCSGFHSNPVALSFGTGASFRRSSVLICLQYSTIMGVTPALSVSYTPSP